VERCLQVLVGKSEGKRPLGRRRWEDNFKVNFREMSSSGGFLCT
jgi:hypothetical protein